MKGKICVYGMCMGIDVHTALISHHPVSGSVDEGFVSDVQVIRLALKPSFFIMREALVSESP